jgi:chromosome segregation protein
VSPRPLYQAAIAELEGVLSPRVVSRSLKEGMAQVGSSPDSVELADLERILKGQIYRQLQVAMPTDKAKETISEILERLRGLENGGGARDPTPAPLDGQREALEELKKAIKPFNLYFEWPEVQKLRAQIQLLESEQSAGREAGALLRGAREQLRAVEQKLEDSLVLQARDLGELEGLLEQVSSLGGPKVRRLENLLGQIQGAQSQRQLATAEVERARKLGTDLRKLLESSVLAEKEQQQPDDTGIIDIEPEAWQNAEDERISLVRDADESVSARLLMIDLESEKIDLNTIESAHKNLLEHRPELRERIEQLRATLTAGEPIGDDLGPLREDFEQAAVELRRSLHAEFEGMLRDSSELAGDVATSELGQALQVARGVLESSLPDFSDVQHIRDLHALALQGKADDRSAADDLRRQDELGELRSLETEASRFAGLGLPGYDELRRVLERAKSAEPGSLTEAELSRAWLQLEALRATVEQRLAGLETRLDRALAILARVEALNSEDVEESRRILRHLDGQRESLRRVSLGLRLELESSLQHAEVLLAKLEQEFEATRVIADQLVSGNFIDDMLGLLGGDAPRQTAEDRPLDIPTVPVPPRLSEARSDNPKLNAWVDAYLAEPGVAAWALLDREGRLVAGRLQAAPHEARFALDSLMSDLDALGTELGRGAPQLATLESGGTALIASRPIGKYRLLAVLETASALSRVVHRLRRDLAGGGSKAANGSPLA